MDLSAWLLRHTPVRPLVAELPGGTEARLAAERVARERGWHTAPSPAGANLLIVAGPSHAELRPYVERLWAAMPAPRARVELRSVVDAAAELDRGASTLRDVSRQRRLAIHRGRGDGVDGDNADGMEMPGGVPMAGRAEDRDGLMLDQLHVPLGPLLPDWPAGLAVRTTLQGDVIQEATVDVVVPADADVEPFWTRHRQAARRLDSCARLLAVAGWPDAAATARRLRDDALSGVCGPGAARSPARWARRVRGSKTLRWSLSGVGAVPDTAHPPAALRGDVLNRLYHWLDSAEQVPGTPDPAGSGPDSAGETRWALDALPALLEGTELAGARLLVASLELDLDAVARHGAGHG